MKNTPNPAATLETSDEALASFPSVFRNDLFEGKVVLVSGGGSGIGKAIAFLFARHGATVTLCGRKSEKLEECARTLQALTGRVVHWEAMTIRDPKAVHDLLASIWKRHACLDVLVNNAGGQFPAHAVDIAAKGWDAVVDTNLNGTWRMMQAAAQQWISHKASGSIVNITAVVDRGVPGMAHTAAARAGVIGLSRTLAVEWAPHDIRVNCVAPGIVISSGLNNYRVEDLSAFHGANPMKHAGDVQDVAQAVAFLSAPSGKFVTGETIRIDGGMSLWGEFWPAGKPEYFQTGAQ